VLDIERQVVDVVRRVDDPAVRDGVNRWVEGSLAEMPEHLRAGVLGQSLLLATWARVACGGDVARAVADLERSPVGLIRQHPRLFRSLVRFAELELEPAPAPAAT
jgi:hypothetical protein